MKTLEQNWADRRLTVHSLNVLTDIDSPNIKEIRKSVNEIRKQTFEGLKTVEQYWTSLSDDGVISPVEKQILRREMDNIQRSFSAVTTQATALGFSGPVLQDYTDTYEDLRTYIFDTLKLFDNIEEETTIDDRTAFNTYFSNYFYMESFVMLAITQGILDTVNIRVLQNLLEEGSEGETALYHGGLYQYTDGRWKAISTGNYKGAKDELPAPEEDSFFLASVDFVIEDVLVINGEELLVNGEELLIKRLFKKGIIYYVQDGVWYSESDKTNWRYAAAFADVLNVTGELPQIFQDGLDALQDQIDVINDTITEQAASLADEIETRQGQYTIINGDLVQINSDITSIINRVTDNETDISDILSDIDGEGGIVDQITDIANDINGTDGIKNQITDIANDIDGTDGIKDQLLDIATNITSITTDIDALDGTLDGAVSDIATHTSELATQAAALAQQAQDLSDLADEVDDKATKQALQNLSDELSRKATALENAIAAINQELAGKISHLPVYLGAKLQDPASKQEGDYYLYIGSTTGSGDSERIHVHVYRWNATTSKWDHLAPDNEAYRDYYMVSLKDILANETISDAAFATIFSESFFTNTATMNSLETKTIYLRQGGAIQSFKTGYVAETSGLLINADGDIDANGDTHIAGKVAIGVPLANNPDFDDYDVVIGGNTKITGDLDGAGGTFSGALNTDKECFAAGFELQGLKPGNVPLRRMDLTESIQNNKRVDIVSWQIPASGIVTVAGICDGAYQLGGNFHVYVNNVEKYSKRIKYNDRNIPVETNITVAAGDVIKIECYGLNAGAAGGAVWFTGGVYSATKNSLVSFLGDLEYGSTPFSPVR